MGGGFIDRKVRAICSYLFSQEETGFSENWMQYDMYQETHSIVGFSHKHGWSSRGGVGVGQTLDVTELDDGDIVHEGRYGRLKLGFKEAKKVFVFFIRDSYFTY